MRRREFIADLPARRLRGRLRHGRSRLAMPVIGFINSGSPDPSRHQLAGFRLGLNETGYVEGRNCEIEYRWAEGQDDRLPVLVADLVSRQVAVIVANTPSALAAKRATATVPIVFTTGTDPISLGLVPNLNRPGGNVTGVSFFSNKLEAKRLGLLHELVPSAARIAYLIDPRFPDAAIQMRDVQEAARELGLEITVESASTERDIDTVFQTLMLKRVDALLVGAGPFFNSRRDHIVALAARHALPAMYEWREFAEKGGLAAYGTSLTNSYRQAGIYAGRILKGVKPADLPVLQPTKFALLINLNTAKALGLTALSWTARDCRRGDRMMRPRFAELHQGQQSVWAASTGRTHDCKRPLCCTPNYLLPGGGHPHMKRREFITLLAGAAVAWPLAARAQQRGKSSRVGYLSASSPPETPILRVSGGECANLGYVEGRDLIIEVRYAGRD